MKCLFDFAEKPGRAAIVSCGYLKNLYSVMTTKPSVGEPFLLVFLDRVANDGEVT